MLKFLSEVHECPEGLGLRESLKERSTQENLGERGERVRVRTRTEEQVCYGELFLQ